MTTTNTRVELTAKQIKAGWENTFSTNNPFCPCDLKSFTKAVNWAERALAATAPNAGECDELPDLPTHVGEESHGPSQSPVKLYDADQMRAYALEAIKQSPEHVGGKLIDAWVVSHGKQIPWAKAIEITAITTKMPDAERLRLLNLD